MTTDRSVVLDVAQLEALLRKTFNIGLDVGRGKEKVDLVRLRLSKALLGAAEAQALAAESIAIERGIPTGKIAEAEGLALHAAAFNGVPDPVFHLTARAMGIVTGLAAVEPDPAAPDRDVILDTALEGRHGAGQALGLPARLRHRGDGRRSGGGNGEAHGVGGGLRQGRRGRDPLVGSGAADCGLRTSGRGGPQLIALRRSGPAQPGDPIA